MYISEVDFDKLHFSCMIYYLYLLGYVIQYQLVHAHNFNLHYTTTQLSIKRQSVNPVHILDTHKSFDGHIIFSWGSFVLFKWWDSGVKDAYIAYSSVLE